MGRRKALSAGPKLQSRGANRSGAATIASEAEVSLPDRRGRVLPALPLRPPSAHRSLSSSPLPAALLAFPFTAQSRERTPHTPTRPSPDGQHGRALPYRGGNPPLGPQLPSFCALRGFVYLNHAAAFRSAQSQRARIPTANGSRPRGFLNRPSPPIAARRP